MVKRSSWLSLTPEPERELPRLVATLRHGSPPSPELVAAEEARLDRLVLHGSEGAWLRYLHGVVELVDSDSLVESPAVASARSRTIEVVSNHHNLLLGLQGRAAERTAEDRARLETLAARRAHRIPATRGQT